MKDLEKIVLSITDKVLYSPKQGGVEYPNYYWMGETLYLPVKDKTYKEIGENLWEALTGNKTDLFELPNHVREQFYDKITNHPNYDICRDTRHWSEK